MANLVAFSRTLDLDHFRAQIGQQTRAVGTGEYTRKVDDSQTIE